MFGESCEELRIYHVPGTHAHSANTMGACGSSLSEEQIAQKKKNRELDRDIKNTKEVVRFSITPSNRIACGQPYWACVGMCSFTSPTSHV